MKQLYRTAQISSTRRNAASSQSHTRRAGYCQRLGAMEVTTRIC